MGGRSTPVSETPIVPVIVGEGAQDDGVFEGALCQGAGVMATKGSLFRRFRRGKARVRTIMNSEHSRENLDQALEVFQDGGEDGLESLLGREEYTTTVGKN